METAMTLTNEHLSYSRIARFEQCPKSFALRYVDKIPETPSPEQRFDVVLRETLERLLEEHVAAGRAAPLPLDRALAIYEQQWSCAGLPSFALFEEGGGILRETVARDGVVDPKDILAVAQPFELPVGRFTLVGTIHRVERTGDASIRVRVSKTGHMVLSREEVDSHMQLSLYHAAASRLWPWADTIELQLDMLRYGFALKTSRTPEQIASALAYVQAMGEASETATSYAARLSPACVRCSYRDECDAYREALEGKAEPVAADPADLLAVAREREQVTALAAILQARKKDLDGQLKAHLQDAPRLDLGGIRYQIQNAASVEYPLEPTLAVLSEATGASSNESHSRELRAFYSVPELARIANIGAHQMRRLLRASGLQMLRSGRRLLVPLSEIESNAPLIWRSLQAIEAMRHGRG
jgi:putative RecB family exonuclease